ncbi:MAG: hypothetical protein M0Z80_04075 [Treponema sp.]|nr:hypothetical protein [Treponema sp.]
MKRSLALALAIAAALVIPVSAFAQLTFNGYYRVGGTYWVPSSGPNALQYGDRLRLNVSYSAPEDLYGVKFRLQGDGTPFYASQKVSQYGIINAFNANNPSMLQYGYAFIKLAGGMVGVSAGKLDVTDYEVEQRYVEDQYLANTVFSDELRPGDPELGGQRGNTTGVMLQTFPFENLSVAAYVHTDGSDAFSGTHDLGFSAYYLLPGIGKLLFNSSLGHYSVATTGPGAVSDDLGKSSADLAFSFTAARNLTATAGLRYDGDTVYGSAYDAATSAVAIVDYDLSELLPMTIDLATDLDFANANSYVEGEVNYSISPLLKARAYGEYDSTASVVKMLFANKCNTYLFGGEFVFPVMKKAELIAGANYGDQTSLAFPLLVWVNF